MIFDAKMAQQTFAAALPHCSELDGTDFISNGAIAFSISKIIIGSEPPRSSEELDGLQKETCKAARLAKP